MHRRTLLALASSLALMTLGIAAARADEIRISGPIVHENLAIYLVQGKSASGPVPLTLDEALAKRSVKVHETGNVNELQIENLGGDEIFVQSGDIVKGGQQDRVLTVSLLLPPKSGRIPIASFCVEQGRWTARGKEDVKTFATTTKGLLALSDWLSEYRVTNVAMALNAASLPLAVVPFLMLMNDREYVGEHVNGRLANVLVLVVVALACVLAVVSLPLELAGG